MEGSNKVRVTFSSRTNTDSARWSFISRKLLTPRLFFTGAGFTKYLKSQTVTSFKSKICLWNWQLCFTLRFMRWISDEKIMLEVSSIWVEFYPRFETFLTFQVGVNNTNTCLQFALQPITAANQPLFLKVHQQLCQRKNRQHSLPCLSAQLI